MLFLGNWVFYLGTKKKLNQIFFFLCLSISFWAFTEFMLRQADTPETAYFWLKASAFWPLTVSLFNHFALVFSENKKLLANKLTYIIIYTPSIVFSIVDSTTNLIRAGVTKEFWGYAYIYQSEPWFISLIIAWIIAVGFFALIMFVDCGLKSTNKKKKQQAKYVSIGFSISAFAGLLTEGLFPLLHLEIPGLTATSFALFGIFIGFVIWKYEMFILSPATAAENIILTMPDSIILTDTDGKILIVNQSLTTLLDYKESELIGNSIGILFDEEKFRDEIQKKLLKNDILKDFEITWKTKNGDKRLVSFSASLVKSKGKNVGIVGVASDITERKRAETLLKNSEEKFRNLAEQSPNMISIRQKGKLVYANKQAEEATGYTKEELYSSEFNILDLMPSESRELLKPQTIRHRKGEDENLNQFESKLVSKKGQVVDVITNARLIDYNGEPALLVVSTDITESKRLREKLEEYSKCLEDLVKERTVQLEQAQAQLVKSERLATIGELASMVGHDLRNPLTGIKNAVYYLKKKGVTCPEVKTKEMFEIIDKAIDHSNKIINDLLDYSREVHLELTKCRISTLLNEALLMIQVPDRIEIANYVDKESWLMIDADKIMRVFINLITNAIDAMPEAGKLEIRSNQTKDNTEIEFADTGVGIPEEILSKIFSPLFTTKAKGMGFGLPICKRIVESHGGTITVKTVVNEGTTFTVTLPIKPKFEIVDEKVRVNLPEYLLITAKTKLND